MNSRLVVRCSTFVALALCCVARLDAAPESPTDSGNADIAAQLKAALGVRDLSIVEIAVPAGIPDGLSLEIEIAGQPRAISLARRSLRSDDFELIVQDATGEPHRIEPPAVRTYRGFADGDSTNYAAISLLENGIEGVVRLADGTLYFIQPAASIVPGTGAAQQVVYTRRDLVDALTCPVADVEGIEFDGLPGGPRGGGSCEIGNARIALVADAAFRSSHGSDAASMIVGESILNVVTAIYESELNISYTIAQFVVNTTNPYTLVPSGGGEVEYDDMLSDFSSWYIGAHGSTNRNLTHLVSRENFRGSVIGYAGVGTICGGNGGFGINQMTFSLAANAAIFAHECGHNWGATHCSGGDCDIMRSTVCTSCTNQPDTFGTQATGQILGGLNQGCVRRPDDCNFNGICDSVDLMNGILTDADMSGVADECERVRNTITNDTFGTIGSAIAAATDGHTLEVRPGTYNEAINFSGRNLTLVSTDGAFRTIIDATGLNTTTVSVRSNETVTINGFYITGGRGHPSFGGNAGGGILVSDGSLTLQNSIVGGNMVPAGGFGGGMYIVPGQPTVISNTIFCENSPSNIVGSYTNGGGISFPGVCPEPQCTFAAGDINGDSLKNGIDIRPFVECYLFGSSGNGDCLCADLNGDNDVTSADLSMLVNLLVP